MKVIANRIVIASDIGLNNNLFGATLLSWLDKYGALFTYRYLHHTFVTYKMEKTYFLHPAKQGDCIDFYVTNVKYNPLSVSFDLVAKNSSCNPATEIINTNMTFVAIDVETEKPCRINPMLFEIEEFEDCINQTVNKFLSIDETIFHNIKHVKKMLTQLKMYKSLMSNQDYKRLYIAICYHDAIHEANQNDNEENSIELFKRDFKKIFNEDEINKISQLILCTKTDYNHDLIKKIKFGDLIHDLDMLSLMDYETMRGNDAKIKNEFSHLTPLEFYEYKLKYFKNLIKSGVFISEQYKQFNTIAVKNIKKYMKEIKSLIKDIKDNKEKEIIPEEKNEEINL